MNILIFGASTKNSIGYHLGESLRLIGHKISYASRSGRLGFQCDVTVAADVRRVLQRFEPDAVVLCAGVFVPPHVVGSIETWDKIATHLSAKTLGALIVFDELTRLGKITQVIVLGGREVSSDPGFAPYTIGNSALWGLMRFLNRHTSLSVFYVDLPFVENSTMQQAYLRAKHTDPHAALSGISPSHVTQAVLRILCGQSKSKRIILGKGTK